jgi:hypothetical protein
MNTRRPFQLEAMYWMYWRICLASAILLCSCNPLCDRAGFQAFLTSPPVSLAALKRGDLDTAAHILEHRLAAKPQDAETSYTLGCVYLSQSDQMKDRQARRSLQARGWQLVEAASGKYHSADELLMHAYTVGRWGKKRNSALVGRHLRLSCELYKKTPHTVEEEIRKTWARLLP